MRRAFLWIGAVTVCGVLLLAVTAAVFCRVTLHPRRRRLAASDAGSVTIHGRDGAGMRGWWIQATQPNGNCVAVLHGIGDSHVSVERFAPLFVREGYSVLLPDSRAHGASGGQFVTYGLLEKFDAIAWAEWMTSAGCRKIYGLGESLGAAILIQAAGVEPVFSAIAAEGPYADLREIAEYRVRRMGHVPKFVAEVVVVSAEVYAERVDGLRLRDVSPVESIAHATTPILLIHGLEDYRTPAENSKRLARMNSNDRLWLVPGAGHTAASIAAPQEFERRVLSWFAEH